MSSQIPGYQVIRKAGDGGMSSVYLAIQLSVGREVALKVLSPELRKDPTFAERFYREANIVGALSHPNVISIYDVGKHGQHYYMAMDYLPGASCKDLIQNHQVKPLQALRILRDITQAIGYVHAQGILHCDIKPDNILFRADGSAVLTDFGIARELDKVSKNKTVAGTPHYMSPEQAQGQKLGKTSDIYSLGILLYELLTFSLPYTGQDAISVAIKHVSAPIPELPEELEVFQPLLSRLMAKRPGARFQNAEELLHAIDFVQSQYLRHGNVTLPLKLKLVFLLHKVESRFKNALTFIKRLQYSFRHGLVLKLVEDEFNIPDVDAIAQTLEQTFDTQKNSKTLNTDELKGDAIALALQTEQAKCLIPGPLLNLLLLAIFSSVIFQLFSDQIFSYITYLGQPTITYID